MKRIARTSALTMAVLAVVFAMPAAAADRTPNDSYFYDQWYLRQIGAPEAWNYSLGLESVPVAVIDSGIDIDHPDLKDNIWRNPGEIAGDGIDNDANGYVDDAHGWDFVSGDNDPRPEISGDYTVLGASHGTINAGIIAAKGDNGIGVVGVTWQTPIMALRVLDSNGAGDPGRVVRAVEYAVRNGAKVINLSFAGPTKNDQLSAALRRAYDAGVFIVAAAGNAGEGGEAADLDRTPLYPVCFDQDAGENFIYGVAAVDKDDKRAEFSNYGAGCVDISAPGTKIISTQLYRPGSKDFNAPYGGFYNGTSVAAPVVSGLVALIRALDRNLTPKQVMNILTDSAFHIDQQNPGYFSRLGRGRIDATKAIALVRDSKKVVPQPASTASLLPPGAGKQLYVTSPGPGRSPEIRIFTESGLFLRAFDAFPAAFKGGVSLAVGDFDGNGRQSIVAGALAGGGPHVRVFNRNTQAIGGFMAYDQRFSGGVSVAAADLDGNGKDEIVTGAGPGGGPHVLLFSPNGTVIGGFFAFEESFRGGVSVAASDLDGDKRAEIIVVRGATTSSHFGLGPATAVRVFDARGKLLREFAPFGHDYRRGAAIRMQDIDDDGVREIVLEKLYPAGKEAVVFNGKGERLLSVDREKAALKALAASLNAKPSSVLLGSGKGASTVTLFRGTASPLRFAAYEARFTGGISIEVIE